MARKKLSCSAKSQKMAAAAYQQNHRTAGITVRLPSANANAFVAEVMATETPACSAACAARSRTVPPRGAVSLAARKASRSTTMSSTPTPRKMKGPTCARLVNGTPSHDMSPYAMATESPTASVPHAARTAEEMDGSRRNSCVAGVASMMSVNAAATSGMSPTTLRAISESKAATYPYATVNAPARSAANAARYDFTSASNFSESSVASLGFAPSNT